ncbi:MAG: hypothetical protein VXY86_10455, partial [Pseudomonadota bacterium]|nr:hypothetical protein [Pseudomonadota bacterium]
GPLVVFYSLDIAASERLVCQHGATIVKPCFSFPGGQRFHFTEPAGNEFAVWSDLLHFTNDRLADDRLVGAANLS